MHFPLALLQASEGQTTTIMVGVMALIIMVALGRRFFTALFEIITSPQASLSYHGKENTFFFALMVVFLGGLLGVLYLTIAQPQISSDFTSFAGEVGQQIAQSNSNPNYREIAGNFAAMRIDNVLQSRVIGNFIWFPALMIAVWLFNGMLFFACSKMFGTQTSFSHFLGALAFPYFFQSIASALLLPSSTKSMTAQLFMQTPPTEMSVPMIVAAVLSLYAFILFCMAVIQAAEISVGQFIICFILLGIVVGGAGYYFMSQQFMVQASAFAGEITSFDPSQDGFKIPGSGMSAPEPSGSSDLSELPAEPPPPPTSSSGGGAGVSLN